MQTFDRYEVWSKVVAFIESFLWYVAHLLHARKSGRFLTFSGRESTYQFELTLDLSFGHNLCFRCPNGSCDPTLDIYVLRSFQWYKELLNPMGFDPCNRSLKIQDFTETPTPKMRPHLGVWVFILSHSPIVSTSQEHEMWFSGFTFGPHPCKPLLWSWPQG